MRLVASAGGGKLHGRVSATDRISGFVGVAVVVILGSATPRPAAAAGPATWPADVASADAEAALATTVARARAAAAALVHERQQAVAEYRASAAYAGADRDLAQTSDAYVDRRNALLISAEQHDRRYADFKRAAADVEVELAHAGQDPTDTPEQYAALLDKRAVLVKQVTAIEDDAVARDPDAKRLRDAWTAASARLTDLQSKQAAVVESAPAVRAAVAAQAAARSAVDRARSALPASAAAPDGDPPADEFVRRYPRHGVGWGDDWLPSGAAGPAHD